MPQTIVKATRERFKQRQHELARLKDAPSIAPEQPYTYENGTAYAPRVSEGHPFVRDQGFDGPA